MAKKWEELSKEEQQEWDDKANKINKLGLGLFTTVIKGLLEDRTLIIKNGQIMISGVFASKMHRERGTLPEVLEVVFNDTLKGLIPQKYANN